MQCDRVSIEQRETRRGQPPRPSRLICATSCSKIDALTPEALRALIDRTVSLAHELPASL